jgi:uncharacterized membrane protein YqjE
MSDETGSPGPATHLLRSIVQLGGSVLAAAQTRIELLTTEIGEDVQRGLRMLLWGFVAALAGVFALLLASVTLIVWFWDTHRIGAAVAVTVIFALVAVVAGWAARSRLRDKPRLLDATRSELRRDVAALRRDL